jgi:hypothetical protein
MSGYNGWANYETWNVALWMQNDEGIYRLMRRCSDYATFIAEMRELGSTETPDGVAWNDSGIDTDEIDAMMAEDRE